MDDGTSVDIGSIGLILLIAIGLVEAYECGLPWYLGVGIGLLVTIIAIITGMLPFVGQVVYYFGVKHIMLNVIGVWMPWLFYIGLILSIIASLVWGLFMTIVLSSSNLRFK